MKKISTIAYSLGFIAIGAGGFVAYQKSSDVFVVSQQVITQTAQTIVQTVSKPKTATILLAGDVMLDRGVEARVKKYGNGDFAFPFMLVADTLRNADLSFVNFEGAMSDLGADTGKPYSFNFDTQAINGITYAGIDVVSLANNHIFDWGREALCDTYKRVSAAGVGTVGAGCNANEAEAPYIKTLPDGTIVAFVGFTEFYQGAHATDTRPGITDWNKNHIKQVIADLRARKDIDLIFVSVHWGTEYKKESNDYQKEWGRMMIDAGADVVIGHHPHVPEEIEHYNNRIIIYSLGNFVFDQSWSQETMKGLAVRLTVSDGDIVNLEQLPVTVNNYLQPTIGESLLTDLQ